MRAGARYDCGRCGLGRVEQAELCEWRCDRARDENGNAPPPSTRRLFEVETSFFGLDVRLGRARRRRRIREYLRAAGDVARVDEIDEGLFAIRGVVQVLSAPRGYAPDVATFLKVSLERTFSRLVAGKPAKHSATRARLERGSGVFLVRDATGVALVDDDWVELYDDALERPGPFRPGELAAFDDDMVTVVGWAKRGGVSVPQSAKGYRAPPSGIRFDGGTRRPVVVMVDR